MDTSIIDAALRSTAGRVVALLTPVLATAFGLLAFKLQDWLGIDLQQYTAVAASFVASVILGGMLLGLKRLEGHARFESAALAVAHAAEVGAAAQQSAPKPATAVPADTDPAEGVTAADMGDDPDDGTEPFMGTDPVVPPGMEGAHEPLE